MSNVFYGKSRYAYFWIIVITVMLLSKTLAFRFTSFDDNVLISDNQSFLSDVSNLGSSFYTANKYFLGYYRPMLISSFVVDYKLGRGNPFIYHLTNLLIHVVVSCMLFSLLMQMGFIIKESFLFSLLFATHPMVTQAVAWIPGRNDSLLAFFIILAFKFFLYYIKTQKNAYLLLYCFAYAAALFTKETAIVLPLLTAFYLLLKKFIEDENNSNTFVRHIYLALGAVCVIALWYVLRKLAVGTVDIPLIEQIIHLIRNLRIIIIYIGKIYIPLNLTVIPTLEDTSIKNGIIVLCCLILCLYVILAFNKKNKNIYIVSFGFFWFLLFIIPNFITQGNFYLEHRAYVPMIGILIMTIGLINALPWGMLKKYLYITITAVIPFFSAFTFLYADNFMNSLIFWQNAVESSPHSSLAHTNLGYTYYQLSLYDEAEKEFFESVALSPNWQSLCNIGILNARKGKFRKAKYYYNLSLSAYGVPKPAPKVILFNMAKNEFDQGNKENARRLLGNLLSIEKLDR